MPTDKRPARPETTSATVASRAASLLNAKRIDEAEAWLEKIASNTTDPAARDNAITLLGTLKAMRSVAGSALTQRG